MEVLRHGIHSAEALNLAMDRKPLANELDKGYSQPLTQLGSATCLGCDTTLPLEGDSKKAD